MSKVRKLHQAIEDSDVTRVKSLVESGTDVNALYERQTALTKALKNDEVMNEIVDIIMDSKLFNPNAANLFRKTPLFIAAKTGQPEYVRKLLVMGAEVDKADVRGITPLSATASYDNHECASVLIDHGANVDRRDNNGSTPLLKACSGVSINVVRLLIENHCDVNLSAGESTALSSAMPPVYNYEIRKNIYNMRELCQMLVDAGCDINRQDRSGQTHLHRAVESNDIYNICFLAENGCNLEVKDNFGHTPFQMAILPGSPRYEAARFLLYFGTESEKVGLHPALGTPYGGSPIFVVLLTCNCINKRDHDTKWARLLLLDCLKTTFDPRSACPFAPSVLLDDNEQNYKYFQDAEIDVLQWISSFKPFSLQNQILRQIRNRIQGPNMISKINSLPLPGGLKKYLNLGLPENSVPLSNICKLYIHIHDGDNQKVWDLIQKDAHNGVHIHHEHSIALALRIGNTEAAKMLLENTAKFHFKRLNSAGDSILHLVARYGRHQLLEAAMDKFEDTNCTNEKGATPLHEAVKAGFLDVAAVLIESDSNVTIENCNGLPMLHIAAASGHTKLVDILLKKDQDPNMEDPYGNTPLHVTASKGSEYTMRSLCSASFHRSQFVPGLDAKSFALTCRTPRHPTPTYACIEVIDLLLKAGADPKRENRGSRTALQCALETRDLVLINHLQENCL